MSEWKKAILLGIPSIPNNPLTVRLVSGNE